MQKDNKSGVVANFTRITPLVFTESVNSTGLWNLYRSVRRTSCAPMNCALRRVNCADARELPCGAWMRNSIHEA